MIDRRLALIAAVAAALFTAAGSSAAPTITPEVVQCDGTYLTGTGTHAPYTMPIKVQAVVSDSSGLRIGAASLSTGTRMGIPGAAMALWRFDSDVANTSTTVTCALGAGCGSGACVTYQYNYNDDHSEGVDIGNCVYKSTGCATGVSNGGLFSSRVPLGGACPNPTTFTPGTTTHGTFFPTNAHFADAGNAVATFDGSTQFGSVPYTDPVTGGTWDLPANYTLSAWIKSNGAVSSTQTIATEQSGSNFWGFGLSGNTLRLFDSREGSTDHAAPAPSGINLLDNNWHKVDVVRLNASATGRRYYMDGRLIETDVAASTSSFLFHPIGQPVIIGASSAGSDHFKGSIDELRILGTALSDDDILLEYAGELHKYSSNGLNFSTATGDFNPIVGNGSTSGTYQPRESLATNTTSVWIFYAQNLDSVTKVSSQYKIAVDSSKPVAPNITASPTAINGITWSWATPTSYCSAPGGDLTPGTSPYFQLADCAGGTLVGPQIPIPGGGLQENESYGGPPNQLECRRLQLTDVWGSSPLSAPTSAYTQAAAPTALAFTGASISTAAFIVSWNTNSNPSYTRYELTYARDPAFTVSVATRAALADDFNASSAAVTGLQPGTTYYVRARAFNGRSADFYAGANPAGTAYATGWVVTDPPAPALIGTPQSTSSILWTWSIASGATGYTLLDSSNQALLYANVGTSKLVSSLGVNTRYDAEVQADMPTPTPASARGHAFTYTWANPPLGLTASQLFHSSATFTWGANGNPADTFYEVVVASEPTFGIVVATLSVTGTTVTATNLFPGATYYARVRAFNGMQIPTAAAPLIMTATAADPLTSQSATPPSPYVTGAGLVGSWQFDEGSGLTTADSSGGSNAAAFQCATGGCVSTPTFAAGPAGLGTAASFSGLNGGVAITAGGAPFDFVDDLTVEAWVNPATAAQPAKRGFVARGIDGSEDFALDLSAAGKPEFIPTGGTAGVTLATAAFVAGQWIHVAGVYSASAGRATLYLNGVAAAVGAAPGARSIAAGQPVAIGNRRDGSGNYTLPFSGKIDSVRIFHQALTAAEVLAEYTGSFVSSVAAPSPNTGVIIALPPNAFSAPAQIYISADPVNHPIRVPLNALNAGLASPPDGLTLVPGSLTEVVPVVGGAAFTGSLGSSATLTLPYTDADRDNLIDNTNPPLAASSMRMYTLNTTVNRWELLPTSVDGSHRRASGVTPHFSVFALFAPTTIGSGVSGVKIYPVPWKPGSGGRFDGPGVTFARLPSSGRIRILTLSGHRVREFTYDGASAGTAVWDGLNDDGRRAASGVYFAKITSDADQKGELVKFAIER
jgi:hypothetical protein